MVWGSIHNEQLDLADAYLFSLSSALEPCRDDDSFMFSTFGQKRIWFPLCFFAVMHLDETVTVENMNKALT